MCEMLPRSIITSIVIYIPLRIEYTKRQESYLPVPSSYTGISFMDTTFGPPLFPKFHKIPMLGSCFRTPLGTYAFYLPGIGQGASSLLITKICTKKEFLFDQYRVNDAFLAWSAENPGFSEFSPDDCTLGKEVTPHVVRVRTICLNGLYPDFANGT